MINNNETQGRGGHQSVEDTTTAAAEKTFIFYIGCYQDNQR